ncbi:MAG: HDIG domain-containing metalloprotein [Glaciecola sp.]|jgi:3'-5' exoribonuclease
MLTHTKINQPLLSQSFDIPRLKGNYFLTGLSTRIDDKRQPYFVLQVSDCTSTVNLYCRDLSCINGDLQPQTMTSIEARACDVGKGPYIHLKYAESASIASLKSVVQLPLELSLKPEYLGELVELVHSIENRELYNFVHNVLFLGDTGIRFIQCPASLNYHHNYKGGLLEHSLEVCRSALAKSKPQGIKRDLAIVASLLHDIGKTQTFTSDGKRTDIGYLIDHQDLTLEICAPALGKLAKSYPNYANELRHAWTCASPGARYGFKAKTSLARRLRVSDRESASLDSSALQSLKR